MPMKFRSGKSMLWVAAMSLAGLHAAPVDSAPDPAVKVPDRLAARLSDESYAVREAATRELWAMGEAILPELQKLAEGREPEAAIRARDLIRKIELGILPDSSPKIVDLVMRYDRGSLDERQRVIFALRGERAFRQILKLYALEKNEDALVMLENTVRGVAIEAARECAAAEPPDIRGAFTYLKMARPEAAEYMAMASMHRVLGSLDEELEKAADLRGHEGHLWRYSLLAAAGRLSEAAPEAEQAGLAVTSARLQLLAGNPVPWLRTAPTPPQAAVSPGLPDFREYAIAAWEGKKPDVGMLRRFRDLARAGDDEDQAKGLMMLFLTGNREEAEKILIRRDPLAAFYYLDSAERVDEALALLEIDPAKPDFKSWAAERFEVLIHDPDAEEQEFQELALLGYFMERRGLHRELEDAYLPPLMELAETGAENFLAGLSRFFTPEPQDELPLPVVGPVLKAGAAYAGEDEIRWSQLIGNLFGSSEASGSIWRWIAEVEPDLDPPGRLHLMARIFGRLPDDGEQLERFREKAWTAAAAAEGNERRRLLELLMQITEPEKRGDSIPGDAETYLRCLAELEKLNGGGGGAEQAMQKAHYLALLGRWEESAAAWLEIGSATPGEPIYWGYAAACMHRAGKTQEAAGLEKKAALLAMGETQALARVGFYFALAGDFDRAGEWWNRAAAEFTTDQRSFSDVLTYLAMEAGAREDWQTAASLAAARSLEEAMAGRASNVLSSAYFRQRLETDMMRGFSRLATDREAALPLIRQCIGEPFADILLADYFFPAMRSAGLVEMHDAAFGKCWDRLSAVIARYPDGENARNSAAWLASRANRRLKEAEEHAAHALEISPRQAAYLDTMAEVHFVRGDREKALEYSARGLREEPGDIQLIRQYRRFRSGEFPPK